jgi:FtsH-binding integral membrane protein
VIALHGQGTEGMSMDQHAGTTTRPTAVTVAAAIWWVVSAIPVVSLVPLVAAQTWQDSAAVMGDAMFVVFVLAFTALCVWLSLRMARGSGTARLWLAVFAAFGAVNVVLGVLTGTLSWRLLEPAALVVAAVLSYLPSVRPFFPAVERRPRTPEPRTIGWDPTTGERITEPTSTRAH